MRHASAYYQLKLLHLNEQVESLRLFEDLWLAQTRAAASPVFLTAETLLTNDG